MPGMDSRQGLFGREDSAHLVVLIRLYGVQVVSCLLAFHQDQWYTGTEESFSGAFC
jgi:hypothetical protein